MDLSDVTHDASGTRAALELRVLQGRQKGARALLASDGAWTTLGRNDDNDLVLREAPFDHAEVSLQDGQWLWREGDAEPLPLRPGQGVRIDGFSLLLCSPSLPWSEEEPQEWALNRHRERADEPAPGVEPFDAADANGPGAKGLSPIDSLTPTLGEPGLAAIEDARAFEGSSDTTAAELDSPDPAPAKALSPVARSLGWLRGTAAGRLTGAGAATALAAAIWFILPAGRGVEPAQPSSVQGPAATTGGATAPGVAPIVSPGEADLEKLKALLTEQPSLTQTLKASLGPDGLVRLKGLVADDEALEFLLRPVIRQGLRITLQVLTQAELDMRLKSLNKALLPEGARARATADGKIMLLGEVADETVIASLAATAVQEIPEALGLEVGLVTRESSRQLQEATKAADAAQASAQPKPAPMAPLPEVISVIGGEEAYIVLADGTRVGPGGQAGAWRVTAIRAGGVTFVDGAGRSRGLQP